MSTRRRALPGGWYPTSALECDKSIVEFLEGFNPPQGTWLGGVAPHAGWYFSGRAAARVIKTLAASSKPDRVVLYGGHLGPGSKPIVYTEDEWETPFGPVSMDSDLAGGLAASGEAMPASARFADNTVEIQMPFVKSFFPLVPVIAVHSPSSASAVRLSSALDEALKGKGLTAVYIGSADLTHYGPNYGFTPKGTGPEAVTWVKNENDKSLIDRAVAMDSTGLLEEAAQKHNTCSAGPIASVIASASARGISQGRLLEYYTSYDIMPNSSFVGYAAIVY